MSDRFQIRKDRGIWLLVSPDKRSGWTFGSFREALDGFDRYRKVNAHLDRDLQCPNV